MTDQKERPRTWNEVKGAVTNSQLTQQLRFFCFFCGLLVGGFFGASFFGRNDDAMVFGDIVAYVRGHFLFNGGAIGKLAVRLGVARVRSYFDQEILR